LTRHPPKQEPTRKEVIFTSDDLADVLARAKAAASGDVWIEGGANVVQQFLHRELIDEYLLFVVPVVIGAGIKLVDQSDAKFELALQDVRRFDKGLVELSYARAGKTR
jgi:dihydrofolate reductase